MDQNVNTNNSMNHSLLDQSFGDHHNDVEDVEPQNCQSTNNISPSLSVLCSSQPSSLVTGQRDEQQLIDNENIETTAELLYQAGHVSPTTIPHAGNHDNKTLSPLGGAVPLQVQFNNENNQQGVVNIDQHNQSEIDRRIVVPPTITLPKKSARRAMQEKLAQELQKILEHTLSIKEGPKYPNHNDLDIPEDSTEFIHHGQSTPVYVEQLYDAPELGHGAFGTVCDVRIKGPPEVRMAVKCVSRSMSTELAIMKDVCSGGCQYIVDYYCTVTKSCTDDLFICMEYMNTSVKTFYQAMHSLHGIPRNILDCFVRRVLHDVTSALYYLEIKEIVHQDIKPTNMLINTNSVVKLCDFGISRTFAELRSPARVEEGTQNYMPCPREFTIRDDMWALGVSSIEIINGENPFVSEELNGRVFAIMQWQPVIHAVISTRIWELIEKLLKQNATERPESYRDILTGWFSSNMPEVQSDQERYFACYIIDTIRLIGS